MLQRNAEAAGRDAFQRPDAYLESNLGASLFGGFASGFGVPLVTWRHGQ